jgi:elongation factor 1-gamma
MSFFNQEILPALGGWFRPLIGRDPYNKKSVEDSSKAALKAVSVVEEHLLHHTYLAGERITLADLFAAGIISRGFQYFFDKQWRSENPNVTRWYETVYNQPIYSAVVPKLSLIDEAIKNTPPKKPEQPKKEAAPKKEAPKPKAKEVEEDDEEEAPTAPKPKHPLEACQSQLSSLMSGSDNTPITILQMLSNGSGRTSRLMSTPCGRSTTSTTTSSPRSS